MIKVAEFTYSINAVPDNLYGVYDHQTREWNGIVREVIDRNADIAVAPMTINFAR
jgi:ionotropic glutamate receptor